MAYKKGKLATQPEVETHGRASLPEIKGDELTKLVTGVDNFEDAKAIIEMRLQIMKVACVDRIYENSKGELFTKANLALNSDKKDNIITHLQSTNEGFLANRF